jgi:hypothetical protein
VANTGEKRLDRGDRRADFIVDSGQGFDAARAQVREILAQVATMGKRI